MKKSLLNTALTIALSGAVFSGSVLSTQAYADEAATDGALEDSAVTAELNSSQHNPDSYLKPGIGIGAATGTLIAGPVGLVAGGLIGALIGSSVSAEPDTNEETDDNTTVANGTGRETGEPPVILSDANNNEAETIDTPDPAELMIAQIGPLKAADDSLHDDRFDALLNSLTSDLGMDVYFRSGSASIEPFYNDRLTAVANLMKTTGQLELHLDGYSDRRGDQSRNIELARERIESVRQQLINAGVEENRIIRKAYGEIQMVSAPGDLEAYNFDRKVVIRFERSLPPAYRNMALTHNDSGPGNFIPADNTAGTAVSSTDSGSDTVTSDAASRF